MDLGAMGAAVPLEASARLPESVNDIIVKASSSWLKNPEVRPGQGAC